MSLFYYANQERPFTKKISVFNFKEKWNYYIINKKKAFLISFSKYCKKKKNTFSYPKLPHYYIYIAL